MTRGRRRGQIVELRRGRDDGTLTVLSDGTNAHRGAICATLDMSDTLLGLVIKTGMGGIVILVLRAGG